MRSAVVLFALMFFFNLLKAQEISTFSGEDGSYAVTPETIIFKRVHEPEEYAFSLLVPHNWITEGGIYRIDPTAGGGSGNAIDAKVDFSVKNDRNGDVMIRFLPDMNYFDMRYSPAGQMGMFSVGSNYNGMMVLPFQSADQFIKYIVFPYAHPQLTDFTVISTKNSPELINMVRKEDQYIGIHFEYDAGVVDIGYLENGKEYREIVIAVTQDFGQLGAGLWKNRHTFFVRAPKDVFENWTPVFHVIISSLQINMQWLIGEIRGQVERGAINAEVLQRLQQLDDEIQQSHSNTNAQINNEMFLNLTGQEEYVNPYTNKVETGSNEWNHRWVNQQNEVIYTNDVNYNPNQDQRIGSDDFKLTPINKRK